MTDYAATSYVPQSEVVTETGPPPYLKIALPITVRELRSLLEAIPGTATIGDSSPYWKAVELGVYRGDGPDRPDRRPLNPRHSEAAS